MDFKLNEISLSFFLQIVIMITLFQYNFKVLLMITICKTNNKEISLNFNSIYLNS